MDARDGTVEVSKLVNRFEGMSTLRKQERELQPKTDRAKAMEKYLQRYTDPKPSGKEGKSKKRKRPAAAAQGLTVVDMDSSGFVDRPERIAKKKLEMAKFMAEGADEDDDEDNEDGPVIANEGEAEHLARLVAKEKSGAALRNWQAINDPQQTTEGDKASPRRRQRHDSPDESPPRRRTAQRDESPPRRQRHDSPDTSPPRKQRHDSSDESPPRKPRSQQAHDVSPPRRQRHDSSDDASPPRRAKATVSDASPPRRRKAASPDESPPRRPKAGQPAVAANGSGGRVPAKNRPKEGGVIMSDGTAAGMVSGKQLVAEMAHKRAEERKRFAQLEAASGSRDAETVYRNKETGARMSKEEFEAANKKAAEKKKAVYEAPEWGGGMRQIREREQRAQELIAERAKPFARTKDDVDEELNLRDQVRFGDPMSHLVKQKGAAPPPPVIPAAMAKQMKKSGFVVPQDVPPHSWLKRNLGPPPNRYGIRPGRHWDGVDRSTGFEREMFKMQATRKAQEREARAWAQADM